MKSRKYERTLTDKKLETEVINQCGSGELDDYKPSRTNMARVNLEGQIDVAEFSRITVSVSVHKGGPAGGYLEILKVRDLMAWSEKKPGRNICRS